MLLIAALISLTTISRSVEAHCGWGNFTVEELVCLDGLIYYDVYDNKYHERLRITGYDGLEKGETYDLELCAFNKVTNYMLAYNIYYQRLYIKIISNGRK